MNVHFQPLKPVFFYKSFNSLNKLVAKDEEFHGDNLPVQAEAGILACTAVSMATVFVFFFVFVASLLYLWSEPLRSCLNIRGNNDYCRVPGTWQLSPLELGEDN